MFQRGLIQRDEVLMELFGLQTFYSWIQISFGITTHGPVWRRYGSGSLVSVQASVAIRLKNWNSAAKCWKCFSLARRVYANELKISDYEFLTRLGRVSQWNFSRFIKLFKVWAYCWATHSDWSWALSFHWLFRVHYQFQVRHIRSQKRASRFLVAKYC